MTTPITISNLTRRFGRTVAVDDVSLSIPRGQLFFLLGPSGCGKTTLLRMIAGFTTPDSGAIRFGERDVARLPPDRRNTGMVFQSYALWPHMTVFQNVEFGLRARKIPREPRRARTLEALRLVHMHDHAERKPGQLSGGQQQRIALARALAIEPDVLLLDEPLSNLDAKLRAEMRHEIRRVCAATGVTSIYVTHDQKEALSMADGMAVMNAGRIVQVGPPRDVYDRPASRFVADFLGPTNFLDARIAERAGSRLVLETPVGRLVADNGHLGADPPARAEVGATVTALVRPESFQTPNEQSSPNRIAAAHVESIYLGEMAQHWVDAKPAAGVASPVRLRYFEKNPRRAFKPGESVELCVDPREVVVLPAS